MKYLKVSEFKRLSSKDDNFSAVMLIADSNNPTQSLCSQLPPTIITGYERSNKIARTPASLSIGFQVRSLNT